MQQKVNEFYLSLVKVIGSSSLDNYKKIRVMDVIKAQLIQALEESIVKGLEEPIEVPKPVVVQKPKLAAEDLLFEEYKKSKIPETQEAEEPPVEEEEVVEAEAEAEELMEGEEDLPQMRKEVERKVVSRQLVEKPVRKTLKMLDV